MRRQQAPCWRVPPANPSPPPPRPPSSPPGDFWTKAAAPLRTLLERNNLTAGDVAAVELLGGTSRVPRLKQALSDVLGSRPLDMSVRATAGGL